METNINKILEEQFFFQGKGALKDKPDHRDHKAEEILAGITVVRPSFEEGYSAVEKHWPGMPYTNQESQFSCVGRAVALYKQVLQAKDTGEKTVLSPKSIYNPIAFPGVGSYIRDGMLRPVNYGVNKESTVPSDGTESEITAPFDFSPYAEEAHFYKNREVATIRTQDFDKLADMIFLNEGIVSGWNNHAVYFDEYGMMDGRRYLKTMNSYGPDKDLYYFENSGQELLYSSWTAIDVVNVAPIDPDMLLSDLKLGDTGQQVVKLHRALTRTGWGYGVGFSDIYDKITADLVYRFCLGNLSRFSWAYLRQTFWYKGTVVDQDVRKSINNILKFRK